MPIDTDRGFHVVLSIGQRSVLVMLAERGKSQVLDETNFSQAARDGLLDLQVKGLVFTTKLVGRSAKEYTLTDLGTQVVDQIYASLKGSAEVETHANKAVAALEERDRRGPDDP